MHDATIGARTAPAAKKAAQEESLEWTLEALSQAVLPGAVGVDVVHIPTWGRYLDLTGEPLLRATYRPGELEFADGRHDRLATRLAGKEAVLKVLGTGIRGFGLREVEIVSTPEGKPTVRLHGAAVARAAELGFETIAVSLCHEDEFAFAVAAAGGEEAA
jgi:phosphopantetheine--protein transferase-like protein